MPEGYHNGRFLISRSNTMMSRNPFREALSLMMREPVLDPREARSGGQVTVNEYTLVDFQP
jgi:hypothetical protein